MRLLRVTATLLAGVVASACDNSFQLPVLTPLPPSASATGVWGGTIALTSILDISITETPTILPGNPSIITGSGTLKTASCSWQLSVTGSGSSPDYTLFLTESAGSAFEIQIDATLSTSGIGGPYSMTVGTAADACLPTETGFTLLAPKTAGQIDGTYIGAWDAGNSFVSMTLEQDGSAVVGLAEWTLYPCSKAAFFQGVLTGTSLVGTLESVDFVSEADFSISVVWNPALGTLKGPWTITKAGPPGLCDSGGTGAMDLALAPLPSTAPDAPPTHSLYYLELDSGGAERELLIQSR